MILCGLSFALNAIAGIHKVPPEEPIATIEIPRSWQTAKHAEFMEAISADASVHVIIIHPEGGKIADAMGETMRYIRRAGDISIDPGSRKDERGKGMLVQRASWDGKDKQGPITIRFEVISLGESEYLVLACWMSAAAEKKHARELGEIRQSIRKL